MLKTRKVPYKDESDETTEEEEEEDDDDLVSVVESSIAEPIVEEPKSEVSEIISLVEVHKKTHTYTNFFIHKHKKYIYKTWHSHSLNTRGIETKFAFLYFFYYSFSPVCHIFRWMELK